MKFPINKMSILKLTSAQYYTYDFPPFFSLSSIILLSSIVKSNAKGAGGGASTYRGPLITPSLVRGRPYNILNH